MLLPSALAILGNYRINERLYGLDLVAYSDKTRILRIIQSFFMIPDVPARPNLFSSDGAKWASIGGYLPMFSMAGVIAFSKSKKKHWSVRLVIICMICAFIPILNSAFYTFNSSYYARWFYMPILIMAMMTAQALDDKSIGQSMGLSLWRDGSDYLENSYLAYELKPVEDPEADWRLDVYTGSCRLPVLINDYLTARSDMVDEYHKDGIAAGFLLYPLSGFTGEERVKAILDFRDNLRDAILRDAGEEAVTFLGGATGLYCGYLDFIAWDLPAVLTAAQAFFEGSDLPYAHFHAFRRDVGGVPLLDEKEPEPDIHEETGSLLSAEDIAMLESFDEGTSGYFWRMLQWLEDFIKNGVEEGKFTEKQAHQDLQIALWYAFACNNIDDYIHYYQAVEWMKASEKNATGCATWYYRYSVALMYCGNRGYILEWFGIPIDTEEAIRERDW